MSSKKKNRLPRRKPTPARAARCAIDEARSECAEWESLANECEMRLAHERARAAELEGELARAKALAKAADPGERDRDSLAKAIDLSSPTGILHTLEAFYPDRVEVLPEAVASAERYSMTDPQGTWEVALSAADAIWPLAFDGCGARLADAYQELTGLEMARGESGRTKAAPKLMAMRTVDYQGRKLDVGPHVKGRGKRGVRMHFCVDPVSRKVVIGHFGNHLETAGSRRKGFKRS